jgi:hypothetical protein
VDHPPPLDPDPGHPNMDHPSPSDPDPIHPNSPPDPDPGHPSPDHLSPPNLDPDPDPWIVHLHPDPVHIYVCNV